MTIDEGIGRLVRAALLEDIGSGDVTTDSIVPEDSVSTARIVAKEAGIVAGLAVLEHVMKELDPGASVTALVRDGTRIVPGQTVATVRARTRAILSGERVALNFVQRLSGIATTTARFVAELRGTKTRLLDTRKTTPGLRALEKYAVSVGGGENHRMGLWDMALVKDNHVAAAGGVRAAVERVRAKHPTLKIEVEVTSRAELEEALRVGVERVMLDNMSVGDLEESIRLARADRSSPEIEISGGVGLADLAALARLGADFISAGAITHSAPALDFSLELGVTP
jgi:nicotinate-nucleotide pyrophosphorylase (carboxylating)